MEIESVLIKPLVVGAEESVGKVVGTMLENERDHIVVMDEDRLKGIVHARDLIVRTADPDKTKIDLFVHHVHPVPINTPVKDIVELIMVNDYMVLPVEREGKIYTLTKLGLLQAVKNNPALEGKKAVDVMKFPYCVEANDSVAVVRSIIKEMDISRVPVIQGNKVEGLVECTDLLKAVIEKERPERGDMKSEKIEPDVKISSFMRKVFPVVEPETPIKKVIELMVNYGCAAVVEERERLQGIVTPRNIFKLLGWKKEGVYVTVSGIRDEDVFTKEVLDKEITNAVRRMVRLTRINYMVFHVDRHRETGKRVKYSVKARVSAGNGRFFAQAYEWDLAKAMRMVLDKLEREIWKRTEKEKEVNI